MKKPLVSVVVPAYQAENLISQCIESILNQTYENLEILIVNDGSTDRTGQICDDYAQKDDRIRVFHKENGGVTCSGGECMLQIDFLCEILKACKENGIHTCIDTSGITYNPNNAEYHQKLSELMKLTDLVMLDIKHIDSAKHIDLTGMDNKNVLAFAEFVDSFGTEICIRHVVVGGITDSADDLTNLGRFIGKLKHLRYLDVLPYHTMGVNKYRELGLEYPLEGLPATNQVKAAECKNHILQGIREIRIK